MLTTQGETSEAAILQRISESRGTSEPVKSEPTEDPSAVNVSDAEAPVEEVAEEEVQALADTAESIEEDGVICIKTFHHGWSLIGCGCLFRFMKSS